MPPLSYPKTMIKGKTIVITGAANGIGRAWAEMFKSDGAEVVACDKDQTKLKELDKLGMITVLADVSKPKEVKGFIDLAINETGKIDGILGPLTIAGIKAFEKKNNQPLNGKPSEELLILLQESIRLRNNQLATSEEPPKDLPIVSTGTGFFISSNHLVTNYHVVRKCNYISIQKMGLLTIETQDQINDIAILRSEDKSDNFLKLQDNQFS